MISKFWESFWEKKNCHATSSQIILLFDTPFFLVQDHIAALDEYLLLPSSVLWWLFEIRDIICQAKGDVYLIREPFLMKTRMTQAYRFVARKVVNLSDTCWEWILCSMIQESYWIPNAMPKKITFLKYFQRVRWNWKFF